jgi:voltage-gated potassium channel
VDRPLVSMLGRRPLTARRAGMAIALTTLVVTLAGGVLVRLLDKRDFPTVGEGLWWAVQTVTTVGYGDITPTTTSGRAIGTLVMVTGIGFLSVVTAAITASFVEAARRRLGVRDQSIAAELHDIGARLDRIEQRLGER